jgi:hypothetical protein
VFGRFSLDYAFSPFGELGNVQRVSATWAYGGADRTSFERPSAKRGNVRKNARPAARAAELKNWRLK